MPAASAHLARRILVVDDDPAFRDQIAAYLAAHGYHTQTAADGAAMDEVLARSNVELIILDVALPGEDGLSICRRLAFDGGPRVILLSEASDEMLRVLGLELGADSYLARSCSPRELLAHVRALLRRRDDGLGEGRRDGRVYRFLGFTVEAGAHGVRAPDGGMIVLTAGEFALLNRFLEHPQRILSRHQLLDRAGEEAGVFARAVDVQISRLRRKLHACVADEIIRTFRGLGYMFDAQVTRS